MNKTEKTNQPSLACVILAAGQGTRMKSALSKVLHPIAGKPMIGHVTDLCQTLQAARLAVVIAPSMQDVREAVAPHPCCVQEAPLGTGHAVRAAQKAMEGFEGLIAVLYGDTPLVTQETLQCLIARQKETDAVIVVAGFSSETEGQAYGRLVLDEAGDLAMIVEAADASEEQKTIRLRNGGLMLFKSDVLWDLLSKIGNANAKGEYYLTDCIALARAAHLRTAVALVPYEDLLGANTRAELAAIEAILQRRLREAAMLSGVTMTDPQSVFLQTDTRLGRDVTIEPNVVFGAGVTVGDGVKIKAFCHIEGATIEAGATIGPFARLRTGACLGQGAHIGNFVEIKNANIDQGAKVNHLSYIGDAHIGARTNIGAGTITCNYDGANKHHTEIGSDAFIGSNTAFVAPVSIGNEAVIGAGSTITKDVPDGALAVARGKQLEIADGGRKFKRVHKK